MTAATAQRRRKDLQYALVVAAVLAVSLWIASTFQSFNERLAHEYAARDALARQVEDLGGQPVAGEPGSRGDPGLPGIPGPRGPVGPEGPRGVQGERGPVGTAGKAGDRGVPGPPGADSTVPGPSGAPGQPGQDATGAPGRDGADGKDGRDGTDGKDGAPGPACPDGYSPQAPPWDPDALVCRRDSAPPPKDSPGLLSLGMDPSRRQYP